MSFKLDKILSRDSHYLTELKLCQVRLIDNCNYPWVILIPMKNDIVEITDFNKTDYDLFNSEVKNVAQIMQDSFKADKLNIATIGNIVLQFHMHIIARFRNDMLFPKTVWGSEFIRYDEYILKTNIDNLCRAFEALK
ncbi:MAG: HIT domain-containing protein [Rickettsiaceae bacterium]